MCMNMISLCLLRTDGIAYGIEMNGTHCIYTGYSGNCQTYEYDQRFPLTLEERSKLGKLGILGYTANDYEEMRVVKMAWEKQAAARGGANKKPEIDLRKLAQRICAAVAVSPKWPQGSLRRVWYMTNPENPVIEKLIDRYRLKNKIARGQPLSDVEQLTFELQLLHPAVLRELEHAVAAVEQDNTYAEIKSG